MRALVSCPPTIVGRCTHRVQKMEVNAGKKVRQRKWFQNESNSIVHPIRNASFYIFLIHRFIIVHFSTPCILNLDNVSFFQIITIVHNLKKTKFVAQQVSTTATCKLILLLRRYIAAGWPFSTLVLLLPMTETEGWKLSCCTILAVHDGSSQFAEYAIHNNGQFFEP